MASLRTTVISLQGQHADRNQSSRVEANNLKGLHLLPGAEIVSFLPLQIALYYNVWYTPLWMVSSILALVNKYNDLATIYKFITTTLYIIMFLVELSRIYLGYVGNLREKVAELVGFWLLTLVQLPLSVYLIVNVDTIILPLERAVNIVLIPFLCAQLVLGLRALQLMVRAQAVKFHLTQFDRLEDIQLESFNTKKEN